MQTVTDTKLPAERRSRASVTKQDTDGRYLQFIVPDFGYAPNALPPDLPLGDAGPLRRMAYTRPYPTRCRPARGSARQRDEYRHC